MGAGFPTSVPGESDGDETVIVDTHDSQSRTLMGCYVWFEYGSWGSFQYNSVTYYCWNSQGNLCSWHWIPNQSGQCFSAWTHLLTAEGSKSIEKLKVGDQILSSPRDLTAATPVSKRIRQVVTSRAKLFDIAVGGQTVSTTREHPVYTKDKGWIPAASIAVGDLLRSHTEDRWVNVESIADGPESKVYNVLVDGKSGYFVGRSEWGFSMWASDACSKIDPPTLQTANWKPLNGKFNLLSDAANSGKLFMLNSGTTK